MLPRAGIGAADRSGTRGLRVGLVVSAIRLVGLDADGPELVGSTAGGPVRPQKGILPLLFKLSHILLKKSTIGSIWPLIVALAQRLAAMDGAGYSTLDP